jgi:hypothetical protein
MVEGDTHTRPQGPQRGALPKGLRKVLKKETMEQQKKKDSAQIISVPGQRVYRGLKEKRGNSRPKSFQSRGLEKSIGVSKGKKGSLPGRKLE